MHSHSQYLCAALLYTVALGIPVSAEPVETAADPNTPGGPAAVQMEPSATAPDPNSPHAATGETAVTASPDGDRQEDTPEANASPEATEAATAAVDTTDTGAAPAAPGTAATPGGATAGQEPVMDMAAVIALLKQQQAQLARQEELIEDQSRQLSTLREELDALRAPPVSEQPQEQVAQVEEPAEPVDTGIAEEQVAGAEPEQQTKAEMRKATSEAVATAQVDDPTKQVLTDFPGAWRLPGTQAALGIGGFVKATAVYNLDPLEINDRFIVGSIPVDSAVVSRLEAESSLTAAQSRLNFDLREPTQFGILRAFIEGDFAEENDTFRLRHAFGQWKRVLAGKTWSAFVDTRASPEEVDFEGLNGRINVRQSQVRVTPHFGENFQFEFSLEDPNPQIENGRGVTRAPDLVMGGRFSPNERLHTKVALLGRQIRAQRDISQGGGVEKEYAWGLSVSGRYTTPWIGDRDSLLFQINAGDGIGRYVNDLSSIGNFDGIFDPDTGNLHLYDVLAGYLSLQHWWGGTTRSNFTLGAVELDNPGFVEGDAYKQTIRASANLIWTPTPRIDIGVELLRGRRENEDGSTGDAEQVQMAVRYRF